MWGSWDDMLGEFPFKNLGRLLGSGATVGSWADDKFQFELPLAGYRKEHVKVWVQSGKLHVVAERRESGRDYKYSYDIDLPGGADVNKVTCSMADGLLRVTAHRLPGEQKIVEVK